MAGFEDLFADPQAAMGYALLTSNNPMPEAAKLMQQAGEAKRQRDMENRLLDIKAEAYAGGSHLPAAMQLANEFQRARGEGDTQRMNDLALFAKTMDRGLSYDPQTQAVVPMQGYGQAVGSIEGAKSGMKQQAEKEVDLVMNPQIKEREAFATQVGNRKGEGAGDLRSQESKLPELEATVAKLDALADDATYTYAGQARDFMSRQAGLGATEGSKARAEYISIVNNQILPLLRDTFGAQFTVQEGESLKATLGDPNMAPEEKQAVLKSFINQKYASLESKRRELGEGNEITRRGQTFESPSSNQSVVDYQEYFR